MITGTRIEMAGTNPAMTAKNKGRLARLLFPIHPLAALVALLGFDGERRDRARFQAFDRDRLAGLFAEAVGGLLDARERRVDLVDQLALAVAGAQLNRPVGFRRGAVGQIRMILALVLQVRERLAALTQDVFLPARELDAEVLALRLAHEGLGFARPVLAGVHAVAVAFAVALVLAVAVAVTVAGTVALAVTVAAVTRETPRHWKRPSLFRPLLSSLAALITTSPVTVNSRFFRVPPVKCGNAAPCPGLGRPLGCPARKEDFACVSKAPRAM